MDYSGVKERSHEIYGARLEVGEIMSFVAEGGDVAPDTSACIDMAL